MVVAVVVAVERDVEVVDTVVDAVAVDAIDAVDISVVSAVVDVVIDVVVDAGEDAVVDTIVLGIDEEEILFSNSFILFSLFRIISVRLLNIFSKSLNFP